MRKLWCWVAGLLMLSAAPQAAEPLLLAVENDWAPYAGVEGGQPQGLAVELVRAAYASQGQSVRLQVVPFARCLLLARNAQVVGCFNTTITDENREQFRWHDPPLFYEELAIYGKGPAPVRALGHGDLRGRRVGITNGYTYPTTFMQDGSIQREVATSDAALLRMLAVGRVDYVLMNRRPAELRIGADPALKGRFVRVGRISLDGFWIAFSKTHPAAIEASQQLERGLRELQRSGRYQQLMGPALP